MADPTREQATLGGGCFWCLEAVYEELEGVHRVRSGYSGGARENPTYQQVCTGGTGHAEVVRIEFDPTVTSFREILQVFFAIHDPTTLNRQGADFGTQYRSVIFYHSPEQKAAAETVIREINDARVFPGPVVTEVSPLENFYPAEEYHDHYYRSNPNQGYCRYVIDPKMAAFRAKFFDKVKQAKAGPGT